MYFGCCFGVNLNLLPVALAAAKFLTNVAKLVRWLMTLHLLRQLPFGSDDFEVKTNYNSQELRLKFSR